MVDLAVDVFYTISFSNFPRGAFLNMVRESQHYTIKIREKIEEYIMEEKYVVKKPSTNKKLLLKPMKTFFSEGNQKYIIVVNLTCQNETYQKAFRFLYKRAQKGLLVIQKPDNEVKCCCGIEVSRTKESYI